MKIPLGENSTLISRIVQACQTTTVGDSLGWIRYSESY